MVAVGRALMTNPRLLLCDELSLGLAPKIVSDIYACFDEIRASGVAIVIVEQDTARAKAASDRLYCLLKGRVTLAARSRETTPQAIAAAYFRGARRMSVVDAFVNGLLLGGLYGLFGLGLAFAFGVMRVANIAQGEFIVLAAFLCMSLLDATHMPVVAAVLLVAAISFALGWLLQASVLNRLVGPNPIPAMIVTMGLSIVLRNGLAKVYGSDIHTIEIGSVQNLGVTIAGVTVGVFPIITFAISAALFLALHQLMTRSMMGRAFRAAADDHEILETLGFNRRRVYNAAMGLAVAMSGIAGMLLAMRNTFTPFSGVERLLLAFEVVIIGGLGSLRGSFFAGLALGVIQVVSLRFQPNAGPLYDHLAFFLVLLARQGRFTPPRLGRRA